MDVGKPRVKNKKFVFLLNRLLTNKIPQVDISSIKKLSRHILFIDTRERNEYEISTIGGALHVGFIDFDISLLKNISKDHCLVVFCSVGLRSEKICRQLIQSGYNNVYNLYGGIFEWINQGHPVVNGEGGVGDKIHAYSRVWGIWVSGLKKVYDNNP